MCELRGKNDMFPSAMSKKLLLDYIKSLNVKNYNIDINVGSAKGDNYLGVLYRIEVKGETQKGKVTLNLMIKLAPDSEEVRENMPLRKTFLREIFVYDVILRKYDELQKELVDCSKFGYAACIRTCSENLKETLIMEDLKSKGFVMFDRFNQIDVQHASLAMVALGKLHALSFVLQLRDKKTFDRFVGECDEVFITDKPSCTNFNLDKLLGACTAKAKSVLENPVHKIKAERFLANSFEGLRSALVPGKYAVLCHGDCWINNMLYRYKDDVPIDIRLVDFQIVRYANAATDILYFIFCCTEKELRQKSYNHLLDVYYSSLRKHLKGFGYDVEDVYPHGEFMKDIKTTALFGLGMAVLTLSIFTCDPESTVNIDELMVSPTEALDSIQGDSYKLYKKRMQDVVADYIEYGYL